jgi:chromosome partitioning protein
MIIAVTNLKGGVGKSTISRLLATYFAHQNIKTCIVDTDLEQKTSADWCERRPESALYVPVFPMTTIQNLQRDVKTHVDNGYKMIIIDGVPQLSESATRTIAVADLLLIPVIPSFDDILSFRKFIDRYEQVKAFRGDIPAYTVMNMYSGRNNEDKEAREMMAMFEESGIKPMQAYLENRIIQRRANKEGLTAIEQSDDEKAKKESLAFCEEVENIIFKILEN